MQKRRRFLSCHSLEECLGEEAVQLLAEASELSEDLKRDHVLRKARQCETGSQMKAWMESRGLQPAG